MQSNTYQPVVHRLAVATVCAALLPIVVGAVVTTTNAGMAFSDWPTSDGHNMLTYPWLQSAGAKFVEHGHRLAAMLIGVISAVLAVVVWMKEPRPWVRRAAIGILLCVIAQAIIGGVRVRNDSRTLAMVHGSFAALVFAFMACVAGCTSRAWIQAPGERLQRSVGPLKPLVLVTMLLVFAQYMLGGALRHLGTALYEHIALAALVLVAVVATAVAALCSGAKWLRMPSWALLVVVILQVMLGGAAFVTRFGFAPSGYVAVQNSAPQVWFRTGHTVVGMLLLATLAITAMRVFRLDDLRRRTTVVARDDRVPAAAATVRGAVG
jgi:cytochrome c oxidase assembly protein subunit 15